MFEYFYNEIFRSVIIGFGSLFNGIQVKHKDENDDTFSVIKVPLAYGPKEKFLVRLRADADLSSKVAITLPRIGFEIQNLSYDSTRKLSRVQKFKKVKDDTNRQLDSQFMPVPYNLEVVLYVLAKQSDDALQIVEQILPFFQPDYTITINDMSDMGIKRDVPIVLNGISYEDNYEGEFEQRRALIYTMNFTCKFYLYGPVSSQNVIKTAQVDQFADLPDQSPTREQRYTVTPKPFNADADDDFGFNETTSFFTDAKEFNPVTGEDE